MLILHAPTGKWGVGGHSLGIYRETGAITIVLPGAPQEGRQRYLADELQVSDASPYLPQPLAVTAGYVEIDAGEHRAIVALSIAGDDFWANGSYPLR